LRWGRSWPRFSRDRQLYHFAPHQPRVAGIQQGARRFAEGDLQLPSEPFPQSEEMGAVVESLNEMGNQPQRAYADDPVQRNELKHF
jgi:hypothetical protein